MQVRVDCIEKVKYKDGSTHYGVYVSQLMDDTQNRVGCPHWPSRVWLDNADHISVGDVCEAVTTIFNGRDANGNAVPMVKITGLI